MKNKPVVILTGASRGVGKATALHLASVGAALALVARSEEALEAVRREVERRGGIAAPFTADIAEQGACEKIVSAVLERFNRLDALINNAGILSPMANTAEADPQAWKYNIAVNLLGPFYLIRSALNALQQSRGRIVNVSSDAARHPIEGCSAYCAAKAALTHLTAVVAAESPKVTAVAVRPGVIDTAMQSQIREEGWKVMPPERFAYFKRLKAEGRLEPPAVPAGAVAWLALHAKREWSGQFMEYDDPRIASPAKSMFPTT